MNDLSRSTRPLKDLSSFALSQLEVMLDGPDWRGGGRLPPESELARQVGVSRPVLRKALIALRDAGRIVSRRGSGNFVQPTADFMPSIPDADDLAIHTVFDMKRCMRFRQVIECAAAEDAARVRDAAGLQEIAAAHRRMLELPAGTSVFEADFAFHMAVARATQNPYYAFTLATMQNQIRLTVEFTRKLQDIPFDKVAPRVVAEHGRILEAIEAGDPAKAREVMSAHMKQTLVRLLGEES